EIPDPVNPGVACNAYGGCAFADICYGREDVAGYIRRIERLHQVTVQGKVVDTGNVIKEPVPDFTRSRNMNFAERLKGMISQGAAAQGTAAHNGTATAAPNGTAVAAPPPLPLNPSPASINYAAGAAVQQAPQPAQQPSSAKSVFYAGDPPPWA